MRVRILMTAFIAAVSIAVAPSAWAADPAAKFAGTWRVSDDLGRTFSVVLKETGGKITGHVDMHNDPAPITIAVVPRDGLLGFKWQEPGRQKGGGRANIRLDAGGDRFTANYTYYLPADAHLPDMQGHWTGVRQK